MQKLKHFVSLVEESNDNNNNDKGNKIKIMNTTTNSNNNDNSTDNNNVSYHHHHFLYHYYYMKWKSSSTVGSELYEDIVRFHPLSILFLMDRFLRKRKEVAKVTLILAFPSGSCFSESRILIILIPLNHGAYYGRLYVANMHVWVRGGCEKVY